MKYRIPASHYAACIEDPENIENFEQAVKDNFIGWKLHHRMETHRRNGKERVTHLSADDLIEWGLYFHRPASELIYLTDSEHAKVHHHRTGKTPWNKGKKFPGTGYWVGKKLSDEHRKKLSEKAHLRKYSEERKAKMSSIIGNMIWITNGVIRTRIKATDNIPDGFRRGRK